MNVQSIRLENWKKFTDPIEIELEEGLNVIYGPNEGGKSTLIDSVITTFYFKHNSGANDIKSLRPWGTYLQPQASITFQKNGQNYRITKAFQEKKKVYWKKWNLMVGIKSQIMIMLTRNSSNWWVVS